MLGRGDLRFNLSVPGSGPGGGAALRDGTKPDRGLLREPDRALPADDRGGASRL